MSDGRADTYARLMEAQVLIARVLERHGTGAAAIEHALDASEADAPELESDRELYRSTLRRYVEALGGDLRERGGLRAVFPEESIDLPPAPPHP